VKYFNHEEQSTLTTKHTEYTKIWAFSHQPRPFSRMREKGAFSYIRAQKQECKKQNSKSQEAELWIASPLDLIRVFQYNLTKIE
ncbi:MAG: hypothetical protein CVU45_01370, partial [Chloroflexi bacterium HGW-Chloroflexi-7]